MTAVIPTLNATVAQIEDMLRAGQSIEATARELQEPRNNVIGVWRAMEARGDTPTTPGAPVPGARPLASVPPRPSAQSDALSVDALANAAARSSSKRTQALGVKLLDLSKIVRQRLAEERDAAEAAERQKAEREAAAAEVARLEEQLRAARAKLRPGGRGGSGSMSRPENSAGGKALAAKYAGTSPCSKGCGRDLTNAPGPRAKHENNCGGGA